MNSDQMTALAAIRSKIMEADNLREQLAALTSGQEQRSESITNHGVAIVVADRGHVWVGRVTETSEHVKIEKAQIIRLWGTTKGLNELVNGPLAKTVLDTPADVVVMRKAVLYILPCNAAKWKI